MKVTIFQKAYDWIKIKTTPDWLKWILRLLQDVVVEVVTIFGKEALAYLQTLVIAEASKDIPGQEKLKNVVEAFRKKYVTLAITDSMLNLAVELLLAQLKKENWI